MSAASNYLEDFLVNNMFRDGAAVAWGTGTAYSAGDQVYHSSAAGVVFLCVTAGTSGGSAPSWNTTFGTTTTDNTVTWLACSASALRRTLYVALYTAAPSDSGGGTEVSGGSYARAQLNPSNTNWTATASGDGQTDNGASITFPAPTANWGVVTHYGIFDRSTGGNLLVHGALNSSKTVNNLDPAPSFPVGSLVITIA